MIRVLTYTGALACIIALTLALTRLLGSLAAPPSILVLDMDGCPQPCWQGNRLGVSTFNRADVVFAASSTFVFDLLPEHNGACRQPSPRQTATACPSDGLYTASGTPIENLTLMPMRGDLRLGDAIDLLGQPLCWRAGSYGAYVYFQGNFMLVVGRPTSGPIRRLDPAMLVNWMSYRPTNQLLTEMHSANTWHWQGFAVLDTLPDC